MKQESIGTERQKAALSAYTKLMRSTESVNRRIDLQRPLGGRLTTSQFAVLEALHFHGVMKQVEISKKILKTPGNLTLVIDNLVRASLVTRKVSDTDRRANTIELTPEGKQLIAGIFPAMAEAIERTFSVLGDDELSQLSALLKRLGTADEHI